MSALSLPLFLLAVLMASEIAVAGTPHPRLLLTPADVREITGAIDRSPGFARSLRATRHQLEQYFAAMPEVPVPADAGGGYTHERHKKNGIAIHDAGVLYQLTGIKSYAEYAKLLLLKYARLYPRLAEHPQRKEQAPGRLFWQSLNEAVWLVYAIQGYDAVYDALSIEQRRLIERDLLRPMADFLSVESPQTFDKIHNHGTWAVAAVGMTGYVLGDKTYVKQALYGLKGDQSAGFIKQIDMLFSPDGYYTEGPYYQRYALMPFVLFARSIETNQPELRIFEHRGSMLLKAVYACVDLSYAGRFFPLNDAIKDKGLDTIELRYGLAIAYAQTGDPTLLAVAQRQKSFVLTGDGFRLARAGDEGKARPYDFRSKLFRDGPDGKQGALAVLRNGTASDHQALVLKATAQGMGHGHFDKLHWLFYDNGREIITDYGAARFLNVEQKNGGRYLPENESWAKQTVAHNTLVVDQRSHFDGRPSIAGRHHPKPLYFDSDSHIQIAAAYMEGAYGDVVFDRTTAVLNGFVGSQGVVIDVLNAASPQPHQYDLPLHFNGQVLTASPTLKSTIPRLEPLGGDNGYQHLWLRAKSALAPGNSFSLTWLAGDRFYTYRMLAEGELQVLFTELGANDPNFNLRKEQALIFRAKGARDYSFVSVLEPHGEYNGAEEFTVGSRAGIEQIRRYSNDGVDLLHLLTSSGQQERYLGLSYNPDADASHTVTVDGHVFKWSGYYGLFDTNGDEM